MPPFSERPARSNRVEGRGQRLDARLVGAREACGIVRAGVPFFQPFALRIGDIRALPHGNQRLHDAEQRCHASFCLSKRIATVALSVGNDALGQSIGA
jgi:hypothetical protein